MERVADLEHGAAAALASTSASCGRARAPPIVRADSYFLSYRINLGPSLMYVPKELVQNVVIKNNIIIIIIKLGLKYCNLPDAGRLLGAGGVTVWRAASSGLARAPRLTRRYTISPHSRSVGSCSEKPRSCLLSFVWSRVWPS
ncbi:jg17743 [Pararge aegeria aegeria]|uniref:Jg17743 protein n=1 Tax=Pararge aegeria aegeria TaxID=348720 RepID=A0A8S4S4U4_9NEOP|nr:jg17743 [Pararge aegeria aegeria]